MATGHQQTHGGYEARIGAFFSEALPEFGNLAGKIQVLLPMHLVIGKTDSLLQALLVGKVGCHVIF